MRRGTLLVGAAAVVVVAVALLGAWSMRRENSRKITADPSSSAGPSLGPLRTTAMAIGLDTTELFVDDADVWTLYGADGDPSRSLRAHAKSSPVEREVAKLPGAEWLVGIDATHVYYRAGPNAIRRVSKTGAIDSTVYACRPPVVIEPSTIDCVADDVLARIDLSTAKTIATTKVVNNRIHDLAFAHGVVFVTSQRVDGSMRCEGGLQAWSTSDGTMADWESDDTRMILAADDSGAVTAAGFCDMSGDDITLHTGPDRSTFLAHGEGTIDVALTPHLVVWCSKDRHDVMVVSKAGGATKAIGEARGCRALATDANSAYFLDDSRALVRIEGLN